MIEALTGAGLAEALSGISAGLAGQSLSDAYDDRMNNMIDVDGGVQIGYGEWATDKPSISGDTQGSISPGAGATPVDAWNDYVENDPTVTVNPTTGGISSGSNVATVLYSLMEENPGTAQAVVKAVAPVAIPVAAAVTALAQAAGVSVDYANLDSTVKENLKNALTAAGTVYDKAKDMVTAWKDSLGNILFPKKAFDAISDSLDEQGIGGESGSYTSDLDTSPYVQPVVANMGSIEYGTYIFEAPVILVTNTNAVVMGGKPGEHRARKRKSTGAVIDEADFAAEFTYDGKSVGKSAVYSMPSSAQTEASRTTVNGQAQNALKAIWTCIYGVAGGDFPEGTSHSGAQSYTPSTIPVAGNLATSYDPDTGDLGTEPLVPIHLTDDPYDATGDTTDPTDETSDDNPAVAVPGEEITWTDEDPETGETEEKEGTVPLPLPIPDTKPSNPDVPLVNPSIVDSTLIDELVEELANTLDPQAPQSSGVIPVPPLPGITDPITGQTTFPSIIPQSGPGFIHVYNPTPAEFVAFGTWLWVTYADATIDKILNNPFDGVIGAHELYATPNRDGSDNIRSAFLTCPTTAALVTNRYSEIDCGTVIVPEFYGNYLDYSPYSQAYIYLPFIGINEVSIDDIVGHAVNIRYRIDSYSGSCIAMIFVAKDGYQNLCYQFAGSCSVEVPMAGGSQAAIKAGMMQAEAYARAAMIQAGANAVGGIGSALMGNIGGVLSSLSGIASNYAQAQAGVEAAKVANKSSVQHSGQFGASHGAMGEKVPFFIIRNPIQVKVVNYNEDYGFPAHKRVIVGGCRGYLRVREVNVISAHATDEEKMAIEMALKGGVYVS